MTVDPAAQRMLDDMVASGRPNAHLLPVDQARKNFEETFGTLPRPDLPLVLDHLVPTRDGDRVRARLYVPTTAPRRPLTIFLHGGGWLLGSVDSHDPLARKLAVAAGCAVLSVDYRRGPEHRFPTAVLDVLDVVDWATDARSRLPVDGSLLAVAGDSAGGNLAAAATQARHGARPPFVHQLLIYPVTTCDLDRGFDPAYEGVMLFRDELQWHQDNYLSDPAEATDPRVAVLDGVRPGLPAATLVLAQCDPIRPQGVRYADALRRAGVPVEVHETPGMVHGFFGLDEQFPTAAPAMEFAGRRLATAFAAGAAR